ncbi:alpha/beta-hydrolase [Aspergillus saccharolyticus JOP 1030-1]|uniref:Alpha/beta-hydrolase n=1 Tax=Aspergillus saccharolyticus JOP 1030-1 TaxID=1450539 RepID=A0A318ZKK3_9EURO|nr:alpha/beta-hydrolase [Aspergillus saccharolyticus JOP 1030-1]PYH46924.1 alpha/beta-hydrolase [Aspergillus saccharolyticus JOP 1030-1]
MSFLAPVSKCSIDLPFLGKLGGLQYENGVQQFCGIPYARLQKRWSRSELNSSWENNHHDGTKLGADVPRPMLEGDDSDDLTPVPPPAHFSELPQVDELHGLVMNIVIPHAPNRQQYPVFVYVHGGSLLYGGANLPIFDCVNLVSHSISIGKPIVCVNFNYRVGIGGFLASQAIKQELERDGYQGCGNFGFTDQLVAFDWVQRYIASLGGNPDKVTAVGESAGGISISNHLAGAHSPPRFHRAVCMSGLSVAIPPWTMQQHEEYFRAVCRYFDIDPTTPDVLDRLRDIPQQELANATAAIQGVLSGTGNPCLDGWFYDRNPLEVHEPPAWLKAYMLGDVYHEGVIFHLNMLADTYDTVFQTLQSKIQNVDETAQILKEYAIEPTGLTSEEFLARVEHMCGDAIFKIPNYATALLCTSLRDKDALYLYHFDQRSRLPNALEGTAYHAIELLYLFGNLDNELNEGEKAMARDFATAWITFAHGEAPWSAPEGHWKVWGPDCGQAIKSEEEDQEVRDYARMKRMLALGDGVTWKRWLDGIDSLVNKRMNMGTATRQDST